MCQQEFKSSHTLLTSHPVHQSEREREKEREREGGREIKRDKEGGER